MASKVMEWAVMALIASMVSQSLCSFSQAEKKEILNSHNNHRRKAGASNMLKLKWDYKLERVSKGYAARCIWDHNPKRGKSGENLFVSTGTIHAETAVIFWYNEISDYTFDTNSCVPGKMCGHYTQVMWYNSQKLACAKQFCAKMKKLKVKHANFVVCNYQPPGNYIGVKPFHKGKACINCPKEYQCDDGLCSTGNSIVIKGGKLEIFISFLTFTILPLFNSF